MGLPVTVYRWDDAGAPQLTTPKPSEIINILQKCLVDGYGSKSPLGWTKEFEDVVSQKVAYRNSPTEGSGGYFQMWSHDGSNSANILMRLTSAVSMSGLDTFFNKSYNTGIHAYNSNFDRWVVIGTSRAFYLILSTNGVMGGNNSLYDSVAYVGDFDPFIPNDINTFITIGSTSVNGDFTGTSLTSWSSCFHTAFRISSPPSSASTILLKLGGTDGSATMDDYGILVINNVFYTNPIQGVSDVNLGIYYPVLIAAHSVYPNSLYTSPDGASYRQSQNYPLYRGKLAGMNCSMSPRCENLPWPVIQTDFGVDHWVMRSTGSVQGVVVNMVTWHE
ncbi:hypothetical protein ABIS04_16195 [Shewanella sp. H8]|uniref:hypothetical protein n=1 Tax=Shewanella sp. H8 TaxID=3342676 RepID=UPI00331550FB